MSVGRRQKISQIVRAALALDGHERAAFLADACGGNEALRREVELLLENQRHSEALPVTAAEVEAKTLAGFSGLSPVGAQLASYRILSLVGAGGMGEVYRARDQKLRRDVALKVLPRELADDPERRSRLRGKLAPPRPLIIRTFALFTRSAKQTAAPTSQWKLVEGQPLSVRLAEGALLHEEVLRYGLQLADALTHAHERGVVHRDLKSANVMVTPEGRAKVLDFGLAKRLITKELSEVTTRLQASLTQPGAILGTLPYMAPEQLRGHSADVRSDVWALGVVLYEMAAGTRPFHGQTPFELSSAILNQSPSPLPSRVSPRCAL